MRRQKRKVHQGSDGGGVSFIPQDPGRLLIAFRGKWNLGTPSPSEEEIASRIGPGSGVLQVDFDSGELEGWDSSLLAFLMRLEKLCSREKVRVDRSGLPTGVKRLLSMAASAPEGAKNDRGARRSPLLVRTADGTIAFFRSAADMLSFIGEIFTAFVKFLAGKANFRVSDLTLFIQEAGAKALPIVTLISVLVGLILAFVGAVQLSLFGAQIYVADLVGIAMTRVMGAVMVGVIMAGRTGASYAAQIGTMQVNEELDALITLGVSPIEYLVLPRMLAMTIMMPLLCLYADLMGMIGGMIVGVMFLDIHGMQYYAQTKAAVDLNQVWIGLFHSLVFGVLVASAGCFRGIRCGRSASSVGEATTSAMVTSIVSIVVATAIITFVCNVLGI